MNNTKEKLISAGYTFATAFILALAVPIANGTVDLNTLTLAGAGSLILAAARVALKSIIQTTQPIGRIKAVFGKKAN